MSASCGGMGHTSCRPPRAPGPQAIQSGHRRPVMTVVSAAEVERPLKRRQVRFQLRRYFFNHLQQTPPVRRSIRLLCHQRIDAAGECPDASIDGRGTRKKADRRQIKSAPPRHERENQRRRTASLCGKNAKAKCSSQMRAGRRINTAPIPANRTKKKFKTHEQQ